MGAESWYYEVTAKIWFWVARRLPKKLVYFCAMEVFAFATSGKYLKTIVPKLTAIKAMERYAKEYKI